MLDEKFQNAYQSGLVIKCPDKIVCYVFIWLYTYSIDYPEKFVPPMYLCHNHLIATSSILAACIRFLGICLCSQCLAEKAAVENMGTPVNMEIHRLQIQVNDCWDLSTH